MGIVVKQFDGVSVTPKDDAVINDLLFSSYGIFDGCGISFLGVNQLLVNSGRMIIKGRQVVITEETIAAQLSSGGTKRGRLYIRMDLSSPTKPAEFLTQVADTLPALTQEDDANYNDGIFEVELCNYDVSEVAISNIVESCPIISGGMDMLRTIEEVMANTTEGKAVDSLVIKELNRNLENVNIYVGTDNKLHFVDSAGADSVLPFSSGLTAHYLVVNTSVSAPYVINSDKKIKAVSVCTYNASATPASGGSLYATEDISDSGNVIYQAANAVIQKQTDYSFSVYAYSSATYTTYIMYLTE